jgi:hypothetical protein
MNATKILAGLGAVALIGLGTAACGNAASSSGSLAAPAGPFAPASSAPATSAPASTPARASTPASATPQQQATQPASIMAPWEATSASNFVLGDSIPSGPILDSDLGRIQNEDSTLSYGSYGQPASYWEPLVADGRRLAADARAALADPMPPVDPAGYRAALSEYAAAGVAMSNLDVADYHADTRAGAAYSASWINSWDD